MSALTELSLLVSLRRVVGLSIVSGALKEVLMPGRAWLNHSAGTAGAATVADWLRFPLLLPALLLVFLVLDLLAKQPWIAGTARRERRRARPGLQASGMHPSSGAIMTG